MSENKDHFGTCQTSLSCVTFSYAASQGFADLAAANSKCTKCISDSEAILDMTAGYCAAVSSLCTTAGNFFLRESTGF